MDADSLILDGNAIAGLLQDVFGAEVTAESRGCGSCGETTAVGAHRVYRGAGTVMRCPACGDLALRIVACGDDYVVTMSGTWTFGV